jgi:hypothetical protein
MTFLRKQNFSLKNCRIRMGVSSKEFVVTMKRNSRTPVFEDFCDEFGIKQEFSAPITPPNNGVVERKN